MSTISFGSWQPGNIQGRFQNSNSTTASLCKSRVCNTHITVPPLENIKVSSALSSSRKQGVQPRHRVATLRVRNNVVAESSASEAVPGFNVSKKGVVIVGGGPTGFGTALMLAQRGWSDITLLEKRSSADFYEPDKSYSYLVNARGQKLTDLLDISKELPDVGVPQSQLKFYRLHADGNVEIMPTNFLSSSRDSYWFPRKVFVSLLYKKAMQLYPSQIKVEFNSTCQELKFSETDDELEISFVNSAGETKKMNPQLIVGCDGANSVVRKKLQEASSGEKFQIHEFPSPASGLRYKVMSFPSTFELNKVTKEKACSDFAYAIKSKSKDDYHRVSLGCLPFKQPDKNASRTANIITLPKHYVWTLKTGEQLLQYFEEQFPQLDIRELISAEEAQRVVDSKGGKFPASSYCSNLSLKVGKQGVVLLGDAIHFFPPDLGQGVNSALEDVTVFNEALEQSNDKISDAVSLFHDMRIEDTKALVKLCQTVAPYQYDQNRVGFFLWVVSLGAQVIANKVLPQIFTSPTFKTVNDPSLSYSEVLKLKDKNLERIQIFGGTLVLAGVALTNVL